MQIQGRDACGASFCKLLLCGTPGPFSFPLGNSTIGERDFTWFIMNSSMMKTTLTLRCLRIRESLGDILVALTRVFR